MYITSGSVTLIGEMDVLHHDVDLTSLLLSILVILQEVRQLGVNNKQDILHKHIYFSATDANVEKKQISLV